MNKTLTIVYGKAGSGKSHTCNLLMAANADMLFVPHDGFWKKAYLYKPMTEKFIMDNIGSTVPIEIIEKLQEDHRLALKYCRFFINFYCCYIIETLKFGDHNNILIEVPYNDESLLFIAEVAKIHHYNVTVLEVKEDEPVRIQRLVERGWSKERIELTNFLYDTISI